MKLNVQVNVLIGEDGVAVLADFGLTKAAHEGADQSADPGGIGQSLYRYICPVIGAVSGLQYIQNLFVLHAALHTPACVCLSDVLLLYIKCIMYLWVMQSALTIMSLCIHHTVIVTCLLGACVVLDGGT